MDTQETRADESTLVVGAPESPAPLDEQAPTRLGRYVLLDRLGEGGMGVVYAAYDDKLDRKVAIKLLRSRGSEHAQIRLVREAQALAKLSHPNVVQIYEIAEVSTFGTDRACLVMEFVDGDTLKTWRATNPRSRPEILDVFTAAGRGLAAAHAARLVHRDFKPDNVMIRTDGRVLVMDFGLAFTDPTAVSTGPPTRAELESSGPLDRQLTAAGALMGTPAYMAPEQFLGLGTDAKTDQFAFCVALFEALYGQRPFAGRDAVTLSLAVTGGEITRPERDDVPSWLREILERGLKVDPDRRWDSMQDLLDALGRDPTRRRRLAIVSVGLVAGVIATIGAATWNARHTRDETLSACQLDSQALERDWNDEVRTELEGRFRATKLAVAESAWNSTAGWMNEYASEWGRVRSQVCVETKVDHTRSESSYDSVVECLEESRGTFVGLTHAWTELDGETIVRAPLAAANLPPLARCTDEASLAHQIRPPEQSRERVAELRARMEHGEALQLAGKWQRAFAEAESLLTEVEAVEWRPLIAEARFTVGELHDDLGRPDEAVVELRKAALEAVASGHDMLTLHIAVSLCSVVGAKLARHEEGLMWGQLGVSMIERLDLGGTIHEAHVISALASVQTNLGLFDEALVGEVRALAIREAAFGPNHPDIALSLDAIGSVLTSRGEHDQALEHFNRALDIRESALGPDHLEVAYSLNAIGGVQMHRGELDAALATFLHSQSIIEPILGDDHVELAPSYNNIGIIHWQQGQFDQALAAFNHAQSIQEKVLGPDHPRVAAAIDNIGNVQVSQGRYAEAEVSHRRALAIREKSLGPKHADVGSSLNNLGTVLVELGNDTEAMTSFERAREILEPELGADHPFVASTLANIADIQLRRGEYDRALELYPVALASFELTLGPDNPYAAYPLLGIGRARLEKAEFAEAKLALERALDIRTKNPGTPAELAEVQFALARAVGEQGERERARELASAARDGFQAAGSGSADELAAVDAWLAKHE